MKPEGMLGLMKWDEETPYMYFFKHGLLAEKVVSVTVGIIHIEAWWGRENCRRYESFLV